MLHAPMPELPELPELLPLLALVGRTKDQPRAWLVGLVRAEASQ